MRSSGGGIVSGGGEVLRLRSERKFVAAWKKIPDVLRGLPSAMGRVVICSLILTSRAPMRVGTVSVGELGK
jgi:hypothetical protein